MRHLGSTVAGLLLGVMACFSTGCGTEEAQKTETGGADSAQAAAGAMTKEEMVKKGEHLVMTMGCGDCHTPKKMGPQGPMPDMERALSGHPADEVLPAHDPALVAPGKWIMANQSFTAYVGPWGTSYAANLTPDPTGLGGWTEEQFIKAMREGKYKGMDNTRPLLPPMPWQIFAHVPDEDIKAMFAYLQSIRPVQNSVPAPVLAGPPPAAAAEGAPAGDSAAKTTGA